MNKKLKIKKNINLIGKILNVSFAFFSAFFANLSLLISSIVSSGKAK